MKLPATVTVFVTSKSWCENEMSINTAAKNLLSIFVQRLYLGFLDDKTVEMPVYKGREVVLGLLLLMAFQCIAPDMHH